MVLSYLSPQRKLAVIIHHHAAVGSPCLASIAPKQTAGLRWRCSNPAFPDTARAKRRLVLQHREVAAEARVGPRARSLRAALGSFAPSTVDGDTTTGMPVGQCRRLPPAAKPTLIKAASAATAAAAAAAAADVAAAALR